MRKQMSWLLVLATGLLSGCIEVEDELTIQADGSGSVQLVTQVSAGMEAMGMLGMSEGGGTIYPPVNEAEAGRFFPAKDFAVTVAEHNNGDRQTIKINATFKDINALLASPYGRAHQLQLHLTGGVLSLKALSAAEATARLAETKPEGEMAGYPMPGLEDPQKKTGEMKFSFRVTLPGAITKANGTANDKSVTWLAERAKSKDAEEFASKLGTRMEASCPAEGLSFVPITPARLGLAHFQDLATGEVGAARRLPDTNKIIAAVKFEPRTLGVTRTLDLSGEGSANPSQAILQGIVTVPTEFVPQRWGKAQLLEAVDANGKDLRSAQDGEDDAFARLSEDRYSQTEDDTEADGETTSNLGNEQRRMVSFTFKAPEWKVKAIARIKGMVTLQYLGANEVVKISNAVPAGLVMDMSKRTSFSSFNSEGKTLSDPRLDAIGLQIKIEHAMIQSGLTMISLEVSGEKASLLDAQVFDVDGKPWPTTLQGERESFQLLISGKPKPPLSLGLIVSGVGASIEAPIAVENVPIINN